MAEEAAKEYKSSLEELTFNSKLQINVLTMIAGENHENGYAAQTVKVIEDRLAKAPSDQKMPALYLMDSIMKNLRACQYASLFTPNVVAHFAIVFEQVDEKKRQSMYKLRQTWNDIFPNFILYALDRKISELDPAWPITAREEELSIPTIPSEAIEDSGSGKSADLSASTDVMGVAVSSTTPPIASIHVNPKFIKKQQEVEAAKEKEEEQLRKELLQKQKELEENKRKREEEERRKHFEEEQERTMREEMMAKQQELMRLQQQKLEMELEETRRNLKMKEIELKRKQELDRIKEQEREKVHQREIEDAKKVALRKRDEEREKQRLEEQRKEWERKELEKKERGKIEVEKRKQEEEKRMKEMEERLAKSLAKDAAKKNELEVKRPVLRSRDPRRANEEFRNAKKSREVQKNTPSPSKINKTRPADSPSRKTTSPQQSSRTVEGNRRGKDKIEPKQKSDRQYRRSRKPGSSSESEEEKALEIRPKHGRSRSQERRKRKLSPSGTEVMRTKKSTSSKSRGSAAKITKEREEKTMDKRNENNKNKPDIEENKESPSKKAKSDKRDPSDILELFGTQDVDYRKLPTIPKRQPGADGLMSPSVGWSKHKELNPDTYLFKQPRRLSLDGEFRSPLNMSALSGYEDNDSSQKLNNPCDILKFAEIQRARGMLSPDNYDALLLQLEELARLQRLREEAHKRETLQKQPSVPLLKPPPKPPLLESPTGKRKTLLPDPIVHPGADKISRLHFQDESSRISKLGDGTLPNGPKKPLLPPPIPPRALLDTPADLKPSRQDYNDDRRIGVSRRGHAEDHALMGDRQRPLPRVRSSDDVQMMQPKALTDFDPYEEDRGRMLEPRDRQNFREERPPFHRGRGGPGPNPRFIGLPGPRGHPGFNEPPLDEGQQRNMQKPPVRSGSLNLDLLQEPWFDMSKTYVPEFDSRWYRRVHFQRNQQSMSSKFELVLNGRPYEIYMKRRLKDKPFKGNLIYFGHHRRMVKLDPDTYELFIDDQVYYRLHEAERKVMIGGESFRMFLRGPKAKLWVDGHQFEISVDAPPENVLIANVSYDLLVDRQKKVVVINGNPVCPWDPDLVHEVCLGKDKVHMFQFFPPSRKILIDSEECVLDLSKKYPAIQIKGKWHGIRFDGPPSKVFVNDEPYTVPVDQPIKLKINHRPYLLSIGGPGHELIIDDEWYEVKFGGPPIFPKIKGFKKVKLQLEGPPPQVKILGVVTSPEEIENVEGPCPDGPINLSVGDRPYTGNYKNGPPAMSRLGFDQNIQPVPGVGVPQFDTPLILNRTAPMDMQNPGPPAAVPSIPNIAKAPVNVSELFSKLLSSGIIKKVDDRDSPATVQSPVHRDSPVPMDTSMGIPPPPPAPPQPPPAAVAAVAAAVGPAPIVIQPIVEEASAKEDASPKGHQPSDEISLNAAEKKIKEDKHAKSLEKVFSEIPWLGALNTGLMKVKYRGVVKAMYTGIQCTSCAARFRPEQTVEYKEHLDWHFRQNKREKQDSKVVRNRRWYYETTDWVAFEEIGDVEERVVSNYFENMLASIQTAIGGAQQSGAGAAAVKQEACPIASGNDEENMCEICRDPFEQFYDDDEEEWHLRDAIRVDGRTYHTVCYEDFKEEMNNVEGMEENGEEEMDTGEPTADNPTPPPETDNPSATAKASDRVDSPAPSTSADQTAKNGDKVNATGDNSSLVELPVIKAPILDMVTNPLAYLNALSQRAKETNTSLSEVAKQEVVPQTGSGTNSPRAKTIVEAMDTGADGQGKVKIEKEIESSETEKEPGKSETGESEKIERSDTTIQDSSSQDKNEQRVEES